MKNRGSRGSPENTVGHGISTLAVDGTPRGSVSDLAEFLQVVAGFDKDAEPLGLTAATRPDLTLGAHVLDGAGLRLEGREREDEFVGADFGLVDEALALLNGQAVNLVALAADLILKFGDLDNVWTRLRGHFI